MQKVLEKEAQSVKERFSVRISKVLPSVLSEYLLEHVALNVSLNLYTKKLEAFSKFSWRTLSVMQ